jgi:hypothetical protein
VEVGEVGEVGNARGVGDQLAHRHRVPGRGRVGQPGLDRRIQIQLPTLVQQHDGHGGELFADRGEAEFGVAVVGDVPFPVGHAVALVEQDVAAARDQDRPREGVAVGRCADDLLHAADILGQDRSGAQRQRGQRGEHQAGAKTRAGKTTIGHWNPLQA